METNNQQQGASCDCNNCKDCGNCGKRRMIPAWIMQGLGGLLIAFVALLTVQKAFEISSAFKNQKPANTISVSGEGKVNAVPDLATVNIGVVTQGTSAVDVKNQNNDKVNKVIAFIKQQGIADADIATTQYNFNPQYDYTAGSQKIIGYTGNQSVTVKVRGVDKSQDALNKIMDGAVNNGANSIDGVNLSIDKPTDLQNQARKLAIDDAKKKAQELATEAGLTLGKVVSVSESSSPSPGPIPYGMAFQNSLSDLAGKTIAPDIQTGSQDITETMTVTFELK